MSRSEPWGLHRFCMEVMISVAMNGYRDVGALTSPVREKLF